MQKMLLPVSWCQDEGRAKAAANTKESEEMRRYFTKIVGGDEEMNVPKLRDVLNANFRKGTTYLVTFLLL